jgi:HD-GYP domain-containing protein (c-di-GMP phosphodiesterase class II)
MRAAEVGVVPGLPGFWLCASPSAVAGLESALRGEGIRVEPAHVDASSPARPEAHTADPVAPGRAALPLLPPVILLAGRAEGAALAAAGIPEGAVIVADDAAAEVLPPSAVALPWLPDASASSRLRSLRGAFRLAAAQHAQRSSERELARTRNELDEVHRIGMALMTERDPDRLLVRILDQARRLTHSDAGSLHLAEAGENGPLLRFKLSHNDSIPDLPLVEFTLPVDTRSIAGYAATTGAPLVINDAHETGDTSFAMNRSFDERFGYRTKSMLVVPMVDHVGSVVGVLQLINRVDRSGVPIRDEASAEAHVLPYGDHELQLVRSLAGQAAISIENSRLYAQIQALFESFVKAAVTAIDQRDPTTAGHSIRVASLTVDTAQLLERAGTGPHVGISFSRDQIRELRYAAMLHDFGKVGVREAVLIKSKKLPPFLQERVESRFDLIRRTVEAEFHQHRAELLIGGQDVLARQAEEAFRERLTDLDRFQAAVRGANEPTVMPEDAAAILEEIGRLSFVNPRGAVEPYLSAEELHFLRIPRGTLDERERLEIESHVEQTYRFLKEIPWTDDLRRLPEIAYGHHEKLNGRGYPRGVRAEDIPVQTRIMTIADIFDALTASDRPYKRALSADRALGILAMEARDGLLDADLVTLFSESGVYRKVLEVDWRDL